MAKKENTDAQVQTPPEGVVVPEGTQEGTQQQEGNDNNPDDGGKAPDPTPAKPAATAQAQATGKKVKIRTTEDVNCMIANIPYTIAKGKEATVPSDVAAILVNAQKAYRL